MFEKKFAKKVQKYYKLSEGRGGEGREGGSYERDTRPGIDRGHGRNIFFSFFFLILDAFLA
jgi:hypothetical protein